MPYRKIPLAEGQVYHIFTKSIAGYKVFNSHKDYKRMLDTMIFYNRERPPCKFSLYNRKHPKPPLEIDTTTKIVRIIAYCLMPTHIHLILEQLKINSISQYVSLILKSYSKYFNLKYNRKGPLCETRFQNVLVENQEQLLHLTRYVHLNPASACLVRLPQDWEFSSYREYLGLIKKDETLCDVSTYLDMNKISYEKFVLDHIEHQKSLSRIKHLTLELK